MFKTIEKIQQDMPIEICGEKHIVKTKTFYVTETEKNNWYAKFVMEDHSVLVIAPFDDFMYFGRIHNIFGSGDDFNDFIEYDGDKYEKQTEDYQIVKQLVFGDPIIAEGEVHYADYGCENKEELLISLAVVSRTKKRADIIAQVITLDEIKW